MSVRVRNEDLFRAIRTSAQWTDDVVATGFNLSNDISEQNDLAAAMPYKVDAMKTRLHAWYKDVDAKFLRPPKDGDAKPWRP